MCVLELPIALVMENQKESGVFSNISIHNPRSMKSLSRNEGPHIFMRVALKPQLTVICESMFGTSYLSIADQA